MFKSKQSGVLIAPQRLSVYTVTQQMHYLQLSLNINLGYQKVIKTKGNYTPKSSLEVYIIVTGQFDPH